MTPALRLAFSLVLSLLLWLPTVPAALNSSEDPARIALRYLLSLLIARVGVGLVFRIIGSFVVEEPEAEPEAEPEPEPYADAPFARRREDAEQPLRTEEAMLDDALDEAAAAQTLVN